MPRIRVEVGGKALELEGDEEFLGRYTKELDGLLGELGGPASGPRQALVQPGSVPDTFGEFMLSVPSAATDTDRVLAAVYFVAGGMPSKTVTTKEANDLLLSQGYKLSNPSQSIKNSIVAKRLFRHESGVRLSQSGVKYVNERSTW